MNLNPKLIEIGTLMGLPAAQDIYEGKADKYITFTYEDERSGLDADNGWDATTVALQVQLITPAKFNYFEYKDRLKALLEEYDFSIERIQSWLTDTLAGTDRVRQTIFSVYYTGSEKKEE
ncbi:MAG: hypothetical protein J6M27_15255 [Lachnospiraceae bacterium]|nr:hypothetical protein [Lachnospiraceae bacterium]MBP3297932.1 hypothetical protein [Lachnospiraceae bacterium]